MHEPLYCQALRRSWNLAWHHKLLWVFGLFAAFLGQLGLLELLLKVGFASSTYALYPAWLRAPSLFFNGSVSVLVHLPLENWLWFFCLLFILFGFGLFLVFVSVTSQGALIRASAQYAKTGSLPNTSKAWQVGVKHFWRLFFINIFRKAVLVLLAVVVGWGTLNVVNLPRWYDFVLFLILFLLAAAVGLILSFLTLYAGGYVIVEEYSLAKSISSAWHLFLDHWLVSVEVALLVLFLNVVVGIVAILGFLVFLLPALFTVLLTLFAIDNVLLVSGVIISVVLFILFILFLGSVFTVLITSLWTHLFMKMHYEGIKSRIVHALTWKKGK